MIISRLELKNWRNFRHAEIDFTERVFLVGPNASGKSNLLDVFRFLRDVAKPGGGLQRAVLQRGGLSKIRCLAARKEPDIEIDLTLSDDGTKSDWRYAIGITQQVRGHRQPKLRYERIWRSGELVRERPNADDEKDEERLTQTHLEQINSNFEFRDIARLFESIRYLHLVPQLLRSPETFQGPTIPDDPYGRNFLEMVAKTPEKLRKSRLKRIGDALREAVPQLKDFTDTKDEAGVPHLVATYTHWRPHGARQREDQFSDGTLRLIGLFWSLLEGDAPLLLEEPELSLHSAIVARLPALIARLQRKRRRQVFVTTHSVEMLSEKSIGGEEVVILTPSVEGTNVQVASSVEDIRQLLDAGLSVGDAVLPRTRPAELDQLSLFE